MDKANKKEKGEDFRTMVSRSVAIRKKYHKLEKKLHKIPWSVEEDALAFLTDAALVGRYAMAREERWPIKGKGQTDLERKIAESIWWLIVLGERMEVDVAEALEEFLREREICS